ncbi:MFS transporter [Pseudonocardia spinosispora]|uniref:MFS transporter n=1 Tax=Pseudonocardia spinosispora TaxID=103441 RepID=UPI00040685C6|nr:MFS transporter [Pseudonocardia spinosispora]
MRFEPKSWLRVALAVCAVGWGGNQFVPLLPMYRVELGLSASITQATFACYVLALVPGLLFGGPVADRFGRRAVLLPASALSMLSGLVLVAGQSGVGWLFIGRLLAGAAGGLAFSSGAAWLAELSAAEPVGLGARRATVAMTLGFGLGPLVAGAIAQWAPWPGTLAYLPHLLLATASIVLLLGVREHPVALDRPARGEVRTPWAPELVRVVLPMAPWVFGAASLGLAYLPSLLAPRVPELSVMLGAVATVLTAGSGIVIQPLARRLDAPGTTRLLSAGLGLVTLGALIAALTAATLLPILVVPAAIVLGSGYGCCLVYGLREVRRLVPPHRLARMTAIFQSYCYLGLVLPYPLAALHDVATPPVLLLGLAVLSLLTLAWTTLQTRSASRDAQHSESGASAHPPVCSDSQLGGPSSPTRAGTVPLTPASRACKHTESGA